MRVQLLKRDIRILYFLWKFKFAPTKVIAARFFADAEWNTYIRLYRLAKAGFLESLYPDSGVHHFWTLSKQGFEIVKKYLPALDQDGYRSENIEHDILVLAAHVGCWLKEMPNGVTMVSEQELRRMKPENYPAHVPKTVVHRPDGYWVFDNGKQASLVALEVERTQKAKALYDSVARFYCKDAYVDQVIWIVNSRMLGVRMLSRFKEVVNEYAGVHSFVILSDFIKLNWQAPIIIGKDAGHTIHQTLVNKSQTIHKQVYEFDFFDTRKNPKDSKLNQKRETLFDFN